MFIGKPADGYMYSGLYQEKDVYQAVFLQQALDDIANEYCDELTDIEPFKY